MPRIAIFGQSRTRTAGSGAPATAIDQHLPQRRGAVEQASVRFRRRSRCRRCRCRARSPPSPSPRSAPDRRPSSTRRRADRFWDCRWRSAWGLSPRLGLAVIWSFRPVCWRRRSCRLLAANFAPSVGLSGSRIFVASSTRSVLVGPGHFLRGRNDAQIFGPLLAGPSRADDEQNQYPQRCRRQPINVRARHPTLPWAFETTVPWHDRRSARHEFRCSESPLTSITASQHRSIISVRRAGMPLQQLHHPPRAARRPGRGLLRLPEDRRPWPGWRAVLPRRPGRARANFRRPVSRLRARVEPGARR